MELIEREAAKAKKVYCEERHEYVVPVAELDWLPTIDAPPVVHGRWLRTTRWWQGGSLWKRCSECGILNCGKSDYCPSCGARMNGGERHEAD